LHDFAIEAGLQAQAEAALSLLGVRGPWVEVTPKRIADPASI